jgi:hypothetical protein
VRLLVELGRVEEAVRVGGEYLALFERERLVQPDHAVSLGMAQALCAAGQHASAVRTIESAIAESEQLGSIGLALGQLYETRARIAIRMQDRQSYERFSQACAKEYKRSYNPALGARFAKLVEDARQDDLTDVELPVEMRELLLSAEGADEYNTVHSRILECVDDADRARCALTLLLQSTESAAGYLFGVLAGRPTLLAALPELAADDRLMAWVEARLTLERELSGDVTGDQADDDRPSVSERFTESDGRTLEAVFLLGSVERETRIAAVLVLHVPPGPRILPPRPLMTEIAEELLGHGDVTGIQLDEAATIQ